jgi:hypothetical protein
VHLRIILVSEAYLRNYVFYVAYLVSLIDLREIGWDGVDWVDLAQESDQWRALVNTVMNLRIS